MAYLNPYQTLSSVPYDRTFWLDLRRTSDNFVQHTGWKQLFKGFIPAKKWEFKLEELGFTPYTTHKSSTAQVVGHIDVYRERYGGPLTHVIDKDGKPLDFDRPDNILAELQSYKWRMAGGRSGQRMRSVLDTTFEPDSIDEIDALLDLWNPDDGLLIDAVDVKRSVLFNTLPQSAYSSGHAVDREYFFVPSSYADFALSVANTLNTNTPLFGLRRTLRQSWPPFCHDEERFLDVGEFGGIEKAKEETLNHYALLLEELLDVTRR